MCLCTLDVSNFVNTARQSFECVWCAEVSSLGICNGAYFFYLQTHGIISRTWITSLQEYPFMSNLSSTSASVPSLF